MNFRLRFCHDLWIWCRNYYVASLRQQSSLIFFPVNISWQTRLLIYWVGADEDGDTVLAKRNLIGPRSGAVGSTTLAFWEGGEIVFVRITLRGTHCYFLYYCYVYNQKRKQNHVLLSLVTWTWQTQAIAIKWEFFYLFIIKSNDNKLSLGLIVPIELLTQSCIFRGKCRGSKDPTMSYGEEDWEQHNGTFCCTVTFTIESRTTQYACVYSELTNAGPQLQKG